MTAFTKGAVAVVVPAVSCSPDGAVCMVRFTVCGWMFTLAVPVRPSLSVAVSWISRYDGYSWSGAGKLPLATPPNVW